jgi:hypothetical protein
MRASAILQSSLRDGAEIVHTKQWAALWRAVTGLVEGGQLWLTALGRSLPGATADKHRIKAADRLLGSAAIQRALPKFYAVLATFLLRRIRRPVILIDWTGGGSSAFYILCASLCFRGRALPLWSRTFPVKRKCSPKAEHEFLKDLVGVVPRHCCPILVTDAGFHTEWFDAVRSVGWDFVGRRRGRKKTLRNHRLVPLEELHALAGRRPKCLGICYLRSKRNVIPRPFRLVLSAKPKVKGRHRITTLGTKGRNTADRQRSAAAREPLVLATSLTMQAKAVVAIYRMRMQIEETFRDFKSHRYGWSLEDVRCRTPARVDVLLLIAALATIAMHMVGLAARQHKLDRGLQANTQRERPVFSTFFLAKLVIRRGLQAMIPARSLLAALSQIHRLAEQAAPS